MEVRVGSPGNGSFYFKPANPSMNSGFTRPGNDWVLRWLLFSPNVEGVATTTTTGGTEYTLHSSTATGFSMGICQFTLCYCEKSHKLCHSSPHVRWSRWMFVALNLRYQVWDEISGYSVLLVDCRRTRSCEKFLCHDTGPNESSPVSEN